MSCFFPIILFCWLVCSKAVRDVCMDNVDNTLEGSMQGGSISGLVDITYMDTATMRNMQFANQTIRHNSISTPTLGMPEGVCENMNVWDFYERGDGIGEGAYGTVYKATLKSYKEDEVESEISRVTKEVAVKEIELHFKDEEVFTSQLQLAFCSEILEVFHHKDKVYLVQPFYEGGDLSGWLRRNPLPDNGLPRQAQMVHEVVAQIAYGLWQMHLRGLIHRDLKPANIFLTDTDTNQMVLADFGQVVAGCGPRRPACAKGTAGTGYWKGPKQYADRDYGSYGPEADWHAFGVILYTVAAGKFETDIPFKYDITQLQSINRERDPNAWTKKLKELLQASVIAGCPDLNKITDDNMNDLLVLLLSEDGDVRKGKVKGTEWYETNALKHPVLGHRYWYSVPSDLNQVWNSHPVQEPNRNLPVGWINSQTGNTARYQFQPIEKAPRQEYKKLPLQNFGHVLLVTPPSGGSALAGTYRLASPSFPGKGYPIYEKEAPVDVHGNGEMSSVFMYYSADPNIANITLASRVPEVRRSPPVDEGWVMSTKIGETNMQLWLAFNEKKDRIPPETDWSAIVGGTRTLSRAMRTTMALQNALSTAAAHIEVTTTKPDKSAIASGYYKLLRYQHHGKPVYRKLDRVNIDGFGERFVNIYYGQAPRGPSPGWYVGLDIDGVLNFAYNAASGDSPPPHGWQAFPSLDSIPDFNVLPARLDPNFWKQLCLKYFGRRGGSVSTPCSEGERPLSRLCLHKAKMRRGEVEAEKISEAPDPSTPVVGEPLETGGDTAGAKGDKMIVVEADQKTSPGTPSRRPGESEVATASTGDLEQPARKGPEKPTESTAGLDLEQSATDALEPPKNSEVAGQESKRRPGIEDLMMSPRTATKESENTKVVRTPSGLPIESSATRDTPGDISASKIREVTKELERLEKDIVASHPELEELILARDPRQKIFENNGFWKERGTKQGDEKQG